MFKKITKLACLSCVAFSASLIADNNMNSTNNMNTNNNDGVEIYDGGFILGTSVNYSTHGISPFLTIGYINDWFLVDAGFNFNNASINDDDNHNYAEFMGHLGMRAQAYRNLYVTFGATGGTVAGTNLSGNNRPWNVGAFLGLDLQATKHFLISAKINPYIYDHAAKDVNLNEVFSSGSLNFSYVF